MTNKPGKFVVKMRCIANNLIKVVRVVTVLVAINLVSDLLNSDMSGEAALYESVTDERGNTTTQVGKVKVKKTPPVQTKKLHLLDLRIDTEGNKAIGMKRRTFGIFGYDVYIGGELQVDKEGKIGAGASATISF